jgi:hypothetical protein
MIERTVSWSYPNDPTSWDPDPNSGSFECASPWDWIRPDLPYGGWKCFVPNKPARRSAPNP